MASAAAPVAPANNSMVGDRYSNLNTSAGGDRYASATPNIAAASTEMTAAAPANSYDRYGMQPNRYQPDAPVASPTANASNGSPNAANISPTATGGGAALPQRPDPNYRPAGTSSYSPRENMLRPGASEAPIESQPGNRVVPASYEATTGGGAEPNLIGNPSSSAPISQPVAAQSVGVAPKAAEAYGPYQGAASDPQSSKSVQPAGGASSAASTPPGLFQNHSWQ
jgi:hypothetical protein